ncbi:MAG: ribonucleoside-diphosphate reductase subunit alpha, partial [Nitrosomonas sp. PRO5]|nr:ribonucleoside-diphosphate reductase subunit alpha [Nitrosomonas sp. PRO5]
MQLATDLPSSSPVQQKNFLEEMTDLPATRQNYSQYKIIRRNGAVVAFEPGKISIALTKAFIAVRGGQSAASSSMREIVAQLTGEVVHALTRRRPEGGTFHIEDIQDQVELALMRSGDHDIARAYVLYREERARERARQQSAQPASGQVAVLHVVENGQKIPLDPARLMA